MPVLMRTNKKTKRVDSCCECRCGKRSRMVEGKDPEPTIEAQGWSSKWMPQLTPTGRIKRRGGHTLVYLCPKCTKKVKP